MTQKTMGQTNSCRKGSWDWDLFHSGKNYRAYEVLGAHPGKEGGYVFRVWAPRAVSVSLVGDFNDWDTAADPMTRMDEDQSVWTVWCSNAREGDLYKYAITTDSGQVHYKADPFAFWTEAPNEDPWNQKASRIYDITKPFDPDGRQNDAADDGWTDYEWLRKRKESDPYRSPMNIYEVHLGSWRRREDGSFLTYDELAEQLIPYVSEMGYTHIEMLPVMEHPFDGSWGYQITGYYSVTSRYGDPGGLKRLINKAHENDIGVILDWVPAHFPKDEHGLADFDGHPLYEYEDPFKMEHKGWGTRAFDLGRPEVISFLISNAFFYCEQFHADGLRVDAVAAMLYLNYDREEGEWEPNDEGGMENKEAILFLQSLNHNVLTEFPGVLMMAEESTAWPNVTKPPYAFGLGFNFKWNMGWMNDTLEYFRTDMPFRKDIHNKLTFAMTYALSENFILPISHDEVVHGKHSLLDKMPGEYDDKFAGMKAFLVFMMTHPGKKLLFMGQELGQFIEWDENRQLDWMLLDFEKHAALKDFVCRLNHYYRQNRALWSGDVSFEGFKWIDADNSSDSVYTYYRTSLWDGECGSEEGIDPGEDFTIVALNLSDRDFEEYDIGVPAVGEYECVIDTNEDVREGTKEKSNKESYSEIKSESNKESCSEIKSESNKESYSEIKSESNKERKSKERRFKTVEGVCNGYDQHITVPLPKLSAIILEKR